MEHFECNRIVTGDCFEVLPKLDFESVAACITSPPYALQRKGQYGGVSEDKYPIWTMKWMSELRPKLTRKGSVLIVIRPHLEKGQVSDYVMNTRRLLRKDKWVECEELIWEKKDAPPLGSICRPRRTYESILWYSKTPHPYINLRACGSESDRTGGFYGSTRFATGKNMPVHAGQKQEDKTGISRVSDVFTANVGNIDPGIEHPAMYPRSLTDQLVLTFSRPDEKILDPFCGSGTTCLSAVALGRQAIGIEKVEKYAIIARQRLSELLSSLPKS